MKPLHARLVPLLLASAASSLGAQSAEAILEKHLQALGGLDKLHAVHAVRIKGSLEAGQGVSLSLLIEEARPNKARFEARSGEVAVLRVFNGAKGWVSDPSTGGAPRPFTAAELKAAAAETFDGDLVGLAARGARAESIGRQMIQGREAYGIKVFEKDGSASLHWVDALMFLELQREREVDTPQGRRTEVMRFSDFRVVEGMPMPFRIESGQKFSFRSETIVVGQIQVNPSLPDSDFEAPAAPH